MSKPFRNGLEWERVAARRTPSPFWTSNSHPQGRFWPGGRSPLTAGNWKRVHIALSGVWIALCIPTFVWWSESILWVAFMSIYANIATHWSAAQAAAGEQHATETVQSECHSCQSKEWDDE